MKKKLANRRRRWFECVKSVMRLFIKKTDFEYEDGEIEGPAIVLCNHVGTAAPLAWELYGDLKFKFWGASEMNSGLIKLYKYQSRVFYHEKKGWNLLLARLFCLIASPLTWMFYAGIGLISTYSDVRFKHTLTESLKAIEEGNSIVIFPEVSDKGYLDVLEGFHEGFVMLASICKKHDMKVPVYTAYFKKGDPKRMLISKKTTLEELFANDRSRSEIASMLCDECNRLGAKLRSENKDTESSDKVSAIG